MAQQQNTDDQKNLLFSSAPKKETAPHQAPVNNQFTKETVDIARRIKLLEGRYTNTRNQLQISDQNMIGFEKEMRREMKALNESLVELKREMRDVHRGFNEMVANMSDVGKKQDLRVLAKYVEMWEPMKFCTEEDVRELIRSYARNKGE